MTHTFQLPTQINQAEFYGDKSAFYAVSTPKTEPWQNGAPLFAAYTRVYLPTTDNVFNISKIIGNRGSNLIKITEVSNIHYIWYNNDGYFELWGDENCLPQASTLLIQSFYHM
jgi:hypothetical protein